MLENIVNYITQNYNYFIVLSIVLLFTTIFTEVFAFKKIQIIELIIFVFVVAIYITEKQISKTRQYFIGGIPLEILVVSISVILLIYVYVAYIIKLVKNRSAMISSQQEDIITDHLQNKFEVLIKELINKDNKDFGILFISLDRLKEFNDDKELINSLVSLYIDEIAKDAYRLSTIEIALVIEDMNSYQEVIRDIGNNVSNLQQVKLDYKGNTYEFVNTIGIVRKNNNLNCYEDYLKAGYEALSQAQDINYPEKFSFYVSLKSLSDNDLEEYKIDLDNKFLDDM